MRRTEYATSGSSRMGGSGSRRSTARGASWCTSSPTTCPLAGPVSRSRARTTPDSPTGASAPGASPRSSPKPGARPSRQRAWEPTRTRRFPRHGRPPLPLRRGERSRHRGVAHFVADCELEFGVPTLETSIGSAPTTGASGRCSATTPTGGACVMRLVARPDRRVEFTREQLLDELGWRYRIEFRHTHEFPDPRSLTEASPGPRARSMSPSSSSRAASSPSRGRRGRGSRPSHATATGEPASSGALLRIRARCGRRNLRREKRLTSSTI